MSVSGPTSRNAFDLINLRDSRKHDMWGGTNVGFSLSTCRCLLYERQVPQSGLNDMNIGNRLKTALSSFVELESTMQRIPLPTKNLDHNTFGFPQPFTSFRRTAEDRLIGDNGLCFIALFSSCMRVSSQAGCIRRRQRVARNDHRRYC